MGYFNVKTILRTDKKRADNSCPVYLIVSIKGKKIKVPTGVQGFSEEWISKPGAFAESGSSIRNSIIKKKVAAIEEFLWKQIVADIEISTDLVRFHFGKSAKSDFYSLLDECYKAQFRLLAPTTRKHYLLVRRRLLEFQDPIGLHKIDQDFLLRFEDFLRCKGIGDGGVSTHHKVLRVVLNYGLKRKIIKENPYAFFKVKRDSPRHLTLTEDQVKRIQLLEIPVDSRQKNGLELTRDLFLFSCYTALRFSDVIGLRKHQIEPGYLFLWQGKTARPVQVPLLEKASLIIEKYSTQERDTIFPYIANQTTNRYLKHIAELCGIELKLHFHLSRHSFGSLMANTGIDAFSLCRLMGHGSIKTTMLYVNNTLESVREKMRRSAIFD
ncbi:tyrosine-type recombinase/integrase [Flavobacterium sp. RHBU_24]|uniref:tyrosine-type recombinase/integrase n=1 Tax=Flavobacterium sp. RHBU_24 TaxID=3391185 RepID=UPI003984BCD4